MVSNLEEGNGIKESQKLWLNNGVCCEPVDRGKMNNEERLVKFNSDTKHRKQWFTGMSFSHPAKMSLPLQLWLIDNFTKEGETILDPMAGSGTILVACSMGRNVVAVELEQKFVDMMKGNWQKIQERGCQLGYSMGTATILQGDARNLTGILADKIITSPPFQEAEIRRSGQEKSRENYNYGSKLKMQSEHPENISKLAETAYGSIDAVISSPPYEGSVSDNKESPLAGGNETKYGRWKKGTAKKISYTQDEPCKVDAVISSPPYEGSLSESKNTTSNLKREERLRTAGHNPKEFMGGTGRKASLEDGMRYSHSLDNIGNLKSDSYLSAMLLVYQNCFAVLKDGGLMVLVTKNFIRNKQQVRLDLDTIRLCEQSGFIFQDRWYRELASQSFWRTIYYQKYPDVEPIKYEDILVFTKGAVSQLIEGLKNSCQTRHLSIE